jgi:hypothetical protein
VQQNTRPILMHPVKIEAVLPLLQKPELRIELLILKSYGQKKVKNGQ